MSDFVSYLSQTCSPLKLRAGRPPVKERKMSRNSSRGPNWLNHVHLGANLITYLNVVLPPIIVSARYLMDDRSCAKRGGVQWGCKKT